MMSLILLMFIYIFNATEAVYDEKNAKEAFDFFKDKYDKVYRDDEAEKKALRNFVEHMNDVASLNAKSENKDTLYVVNKFADVDAKEYFEKYAVELEPYDIVFDNSATSKFLRQKRIETNFLRENKMGKNNFLREQEKEKKGVAPMFDLNDAEELFEEHLKKYNKTLSKSKRERTIHFLRFVKTLVEINKQNFEGEGDMKTLNETADIVKEPNEYFF